MNRTTRLNWKEIYKRDYSLFSLLLSSKNSTECRSILKVVQSKEVSF